MRLRKEIRVLFTLLLIFASRTAVLQTAGTPESPWEPDIRAFEKADSLQPPPSGAALFIGSSSIRLWKDLPSYFPQTRVIQRGIGGCQIEDVIRYADRMIIPYRPGRIFLYAGDNDIAGGKSPERVLADFQRLADTVLSRLPDARLAFIAVKPSPSRWHLVEKARIANGLVQEYCLTGPRLDFIDVFSPMLERNRPRPEYFLADSLHLSPAGYSLWKKVLAPYLQ
jgi:lysophospholipase L1-like esterase